jgi:hypothetical protein
MFSGMKLDKFRQALTVCDLVTFYWIMRGCIQKFPDRVDNEIYAYNNKHSLWSNTKGYGGKTH